MVLEREDWTVHSVVLERVDGAWRAGDSKRLQTLAAPRSLVQNGGIPLLLSGPDASPRWVRLISGLPAETPRDLSPEFDAFAPAAEGGYLFAHRKNFKRCVAFTLYECGLFTGYEGTTVAFPEPLVDPGPYPVAAAEPTPLPLRGLDAQGDPVSIEIVTQPEHGSLEGQWPDLVYTPRDPSFTGTDSFLARAKDGVHTSGDVTVYLERLAAPEQPEPAPLPPTSGCGCGSAPGSSVGVMLLALALWGARRGTRSGACPVRARPV